MLKLQLFYFAIAERHYNISFQYCCYNISNDDIFAILSVWDKK